MTRGVCRLYHYVLYIKICAIDRRNAGAAPGFGTKTLLGVAAGSIGAFVGTPAEVALIRMTADGRLPVEQRRNYKNVADALIRYLEDCF